MLRKHCDHICTYFAVEYAPQFGVRIAEASERVFTETKPPHANAHIPLGCTFRWPTERYFLTIDFRRIGWQSLGFREWIDNHGEHAAVIKGALDAIGIGELKRIGFKVSAYLPLQMSHEELRELMFGSFLASSEVLDGVLTQPIDPLVQFEGTRNDFKYILAMTPLNKDQITNAFRQQKNLEHFLKDKLLDTGVKDFQDRITKSDCFFFDIDLFQTDVAVETVDSFVDGALTECQVVADACIRHLRSQPVSREK